MGCLYADALERNGCNTTLLLRAGTTATGTIPVTVQRDGDVDEVQIRAATTETCGAISHLLVTTKAQDVLTAVMAVSEHLTGDCTLLLLVNGLGLAEQLQADYPQLDIYCGTTTEGAYRIAAQHIHHAGRGETRIGQRERAEPPAWFEQWSRAIDTCTWDTNIESALWSKLAVNCTINPLTALHRCPNGELGKRSELTTEVNNLCREIAQICRAAGFDDVAALLPQTVADVIEGTADNRSSMLQDVLAGRPTEIDYITGYLVKVAAQHGIEAPLNNTLLQSIKNIDH
jgi:2-dehydropantoate 2-reductase